MSVKLSQYEMIDQRNGNDQRTDDCGDWRGPVDDAFGHLVVFTHLVIVGIAAALFAGGVIFLVVIVQVIIEIVGVVHLGALVLVIFIGEQAALGGVTAYALFFLVVLILRGGKALGIVSGSGLVVVLKLAVDGSLRSGSSGGRIRFRGNRLLRGGLLRY